MSTPLTMEFDLHVERRGKGARKELREGAATLEPQPGRVPRVSRLLALAHRFETMIKAGEVKDYAELARLGKVTRARVSQIMSLLNLAPDIQEAILDLAPVGRGRDSMVMRDLLPVALQLEWPKQRRLWRQLAGD
jgi:hypothetical protein